MSRASNISSAEISSVKDLSGWLEQGSTDKGDLVIGSEHEKIVYVTSTKKSAPYQGEHALHTLLDKLQGYGWQGIFENGNLIELQRDTAVISLEPAGQLELSTPVYQNIHDIADEVDAYIAEVLAVCDTIGLDVMGVGYHPTQNYTDLPRVPKTRYENFDALMKNMDGQAQNALKMLYMTSSTQANFGFENERDMVKKLRVSLALQPIVTALFANSPFVDGAPNGIQSNRSHIVHNAVNGRYGFMLPIAFEKGFGFEKFADYALNEMPLMGIYQDDCFVQVGQDTFSQFMQGKLDICPGRKATLNDWSDHLNCIWSEVRLRQFLEMRGADTGPAEMVKALPALWAGVLYDDQALDQAYELIKGWTNEDREYLRVMVPVTGLQTEFQGTTVQQVAKQVLALADKGLANRNIKDRHGRNETQYLEPLHEIAESGKNWAMRLAERYDTSWKRDISKVFHDMSYRNSPSVIQTMDHVPSPRTVRRHKGNKDPRSKI